jgi:hypothetical protein
MVFLLEKGNHLDFLKKELRYIMNICEDTNCRNCGWKKKLIDYDKGDILSSVEDGKKA